MIQESVQTAKEIIAQPEVTSHTNGWVWVALIELIVIIFLIRDRFKRGNASEKQEFKEEAMKGDVDFDNIINSSFHSVSLYDELKVKCHPDRFPNDPEKIAIAEALFQEITQNKTNLKKLEELKQEAIQKLNIEF